MQDPNPVQNQSTQRVNLHSQQAGHHIEPPEVSGHKEHGPIVTVKSEFTKPVEVQPEIAPSTPEIMIPPELEKSIEKSPAAQEPKIENTPAKLAKESTPVMPIIKTPTGIIRLPMTYKEALQKEKSSSFWESMHWYAALILYQLRKYNIKKTHT